MPPWVMVGPSSTTSTRLPAGSVSSRVTGEAASSIGTSGSTRLMPAISRPVCSGPAASALLAITRSAMRSTASPG